MPKKSSQESKPTAFTPVDDFTDETMNRNAKKNGKAKMKNRKVKKNGSTETDSAAENEVSSAPIVASIDDDAALALKLQEEEEKLAKAFSQQAGEDSWAEVTPKKSRRRSNDQTVVDTAATAVQCTEHDLFR
jgi:hypothetical protein